MGQYRQITRTVTLDATGGANDTLRAWDAPTSDPLAQISIVLSTRGQITAAGNLDWEVFLGGKFAGTPYALTSTHSAGVSQSSGNIAGGVEVLATVYNSTNLIPINNPASANYQNDPGFPVVIELTNNKASALTVYVTFVSRTINTNV